MATDICKQCNNTQNNINGLYCNKLKRYVERSVKTPCNPQNTNNMNSETNTKGQLTIIRPDNISVIVKAAPQSYDDNKLSHDNCLQAGQDILALIEKNGMTDEIDQKAAVFIEKARKTVKKMNERRSPITKLFDEVRTAFTAIENNIDPAKANTIPFKLQQYRNSYAVKKREAEEKRLREELARQQAQQARERLQIDMEDDLRSQFKTLLGISINAIRELDCNITLENYDNNYSLISNTVDSIPEIWKTELRSTIRIPSNISTVDVQAIEKELIGKLMPVFQEQFAFEINELKTFILDRLPSKKTNLEHIAKLNAEEAARIKAEMEKKDKEEAVRLEQERIAREEEEKRQADLKKQASEMNILFAEQATISEYQPKTRVTKKIRLLNPEGILPIISLWWSKEGCTLTTDELAKIFKKQITFCEKEASKEGNFINDESVEYIEDVKAK